MATINLTNVKKIYDNGVTAVHDFNLQINDKEFVVFVGPSGCGKSTTLRMIAGLEDISEGEVAIDDLVVNDLPPKDRDIAMVFQNYALYPHLTVFENMAFPLRLCAQTIRYQDRIDTYKRRIEELDNFDEITIENITKEIESYEPAANDGDKTAKKEIKYRQKKIEKIKASIEKNKVRYAKEQEYLRGEIAVCEGHISNGEETTYEKLSHEEIYERVMGAAKTLSITEYLTRKPRALSGGQRQRVAIGRAMVRNSKVFLMDEPLSNLDAKLRNQMRAEIILLRNKINSTFIYVTHDQTEAMTLGDRIVIMKDGFIQQVGTPQEVFDTPANLFVAGFIGAPQMNLFNNAFISSDNNKYSVNVLGCKFDFLDKENEILSQRNLSENNACVLGVRPEHMNVYFEQKENTIPATIEVTEMMGSEIHFHLVCEDGSKIIVRTPTLNLSVEEKNKIVINQTIYIGFDPKAIHVFDKDTELSILHPELAYTIK